MQRQAVRCTTGSGSRNRYGEVKSAVDSGVAEVAEQAGVVESSTSTSITIRHDDGTKKTYKTDKIPEK